MKPAFFATPAEFRAWLERHHETDTELLVGFYKKASGKPSMSWSEAVGEALCFGWIDGVGKSLGEAAHTNRFTPRKPSSTWSNVNVRRVEELIAQGLMRPAGLRAFEARRTERTGTYSFEQKGAVALDAAAERRFRANKAAWAFFKARAASYRKASIWWVVSAKKSETREKRLATLIEDSAKGRTIRHLTRPGTRA
ncbi:MAG: YdeI/OmpD-associated family protein [Dehalococcoidia bacterium]